MNPHRNAQVNLNREPEETTAPGGEIQEALLEIEEDARRLKNRYLKETIVPEGGE